MWTYSAHCSRRSRAKCARRIGHLGQMDIIPGIRRNSRPHKASVPSSAISRRQRCSVFSGTSKSSAARLTVMPGCRDRATASRLNSLLNLRHDFP